VQINAWCGRCGQQFALTEVLVPPRTGQCPRCGESFAADYTAVVAAATQSFSSAAEQLSAAGDALRDMAPRLHIDTVDLGEQLRSALDH
jgi:hypothetical protein